MDPHLSPLLQGSVPRSISGCSDAESSCSPAHCCDYCLPAAGPAAVPQGKGFRSVSFGGKRCGPVGISRPPQGTSLGPSALGKLGTERLMGRNCPLHLLWAQLPCLASLQHSSALGKVQEWMRERSVQSQQGARKPWAPDARLSGRRDQALTEKVPSLGRGNR